MRNIFTMLRVPVIISFVAVLPFMIMELINRRNFHEDFLVLLFGILWLVPVLFIIILVPVVQHIRPGNKMKMTFFSLLTRLAFLILLAWFWGSIILDQMPCFLGIRNCD